jgi:hypothetical protein
MSRLLLVQAARHPSSRIINNVRHFHTMIYAAISYLCLAAIISGFVVRFSLTKHVDKERMNNIGDPSRAYSFLGPSYEVLNDRGRSLLKTSYVLFGSGFLLPFMIGVFRRFLS